MPTNPAKPNSAAAVDRLVLGIDSPRGANPAWNDGPPPFCFEAEASGGITCSLCTCVCLEAE